MTARVHVRMLLYTLVLLLLVQCHIAHAKHTDSSSDDNTHTDTKSTSKPTHDIGPVIGRDDHDYLPHIRPVKSSKGQHRHHTHDSANDDAVSSHHEKDADKSPEPALMAPVNSHNNYYTDKDEDTHASTKSGSSAQGSGKLNRYDQAIADAGQSDKPAENKPESSKKPAKRQPKPVQPDESVKDEMDDKVDARHRKPAHTAGKPAASDKASKHDGNSDSRTVKSDRPDVVDKANKHQPKSAPPPSASTTDDKLKSDLDRTEADKQNDDLQQSPPGQDSHLGKTEDTFPSQADAPTPPETAPVPVPPPEPLPPAPTQPYSMSLTIEKHTIYLDDQPIYIKGVHYSPSPIGVSTAMYPYGDWLLSGYRGLWNRDMELMRDMGANTVFIDDWRNDADHGYFLDTLKEYGLKCIITFGVSGPIQQEWQRQSILGSFNYQVQKYLRHPAILGWSFGAGMNAPWNGNMLQQVSDAFGCGYYAADYNQNQNGCFNNPTGCTWPISCVYQHLFEFVNTAALYTKNTMGGADKSEFPHLIFTGLSDVDLFAQRVGDFEHFAPLIDFWGLQSYRGKTFGAANESLLYQFSKQSTKPLVITEYGVDAYNDPCGSGWNSPCYNMLGEEESGYGENEDLQAEWIHALTSELWDHRSSEPQTHKKNAKNDKKYLLKHSGSVAGAIVNAYVDEYWRAMTSSVRGCYGPIGYGHPGFDASMCEYKAHVVCASADAGYHSLCGYIVGGSTFDGYANVAWFGITKPIATAAGQLDIIQPRLAYRRLQDIWYVSPYGYRWIWAVIAVLIIGSIITAYVYSKYKQRMVELTKLEQEVTDSVRQSQRQYASESTPLTGRT